MNKPNDPPTKEPIINPILACYLSSDALFLRILNFLYLAVSFSGS